MQTDQITLITVIANLLIQPIIQYMLASHCTKIRCCCGMIDMDRDVEDHSKTATLPATTIKLTFFEKVV